MGFTSVAQSRGKMGMSSAFNSLTTCLELVFRTTEILY